LIEGVVPASPSFPLAWVSQRSGRSRNCVAHQGYPARAPFTCGRSLISLVVVPLPCVTAPCTLRSCAVSRRLARAHVALLLVVPSLVASLVALGLAFGKDEVLAIAIDWDPRPSVLGHSHLTSTSPRARDCADAGFL
ncbi:hypothetical protein BD626DRAFT_635491, partial [Schizophyllum amplum]